jgi:hypothetical protein
MPILDPRYLDGRRRARLPVVVIVAADRITAITASGRRAWQSARDRGGQLDT